jgi:hypothetical protein
VPLHEDRGALDRKFDATRLDALRDLKANWKEETMRRQS